MSEESPLQENLTSPLSVAAVSDTEHQPTPPPAAAANAGLTSPVSAALSTEENNELQGSLSAPALEALEQRYSDVIRALHAEPQLEPFRIEFEKLHRLLRSSHDAEQRLLRQARELRSELGTHQHKIHVAMELSQEDEEAIRTLRGEIEAAWARADQAHEQEQRSRELVSALQVQVTELDALVEKTAGLSMGQEAYLRDLFAAKKAREEEGVLLESRLAHAQAEHSHAAGQLNEAEVAADAIVSEVRTMRSTYQQLLTNLEMEQRARAAKEATVRQYRESTEACVRELEQHKARVEAAVQDEKTTAKDVDALSAEVQQLTKTVHERQEKFRAEATRVTAVERANASLAGDVPQRQAVLRELTESLRKEQKRLRGLEMTARAQQAELAALVEKRAAAVEAVQQRNANVDAAIDRLTQEERTEKALEEVVAKAMQSKTRTQTANASQASARQQKEGQRVMEAGKRHRLEQQMEQLRSDNQKLRKAVHYAEQNKERDAATAQQALTGYYRTVDAIRQRRGEAKAIEDEISLHQRKLKAQQELLNTVSTDRQRTEKHLQETLEELKQLQLKQSSKQDDLDAVKNELIQQEASMCQLHGLARQLAKDVANTEQRLQFLREDRQHAESRVDALGVEAQQLRQVIANCDHAAQQQATRLAVIARERGTLATQLLRRTEELAAVREKVQLLNSIRTMGEHRYQHAMRKLLSTREKLMEQRLRCRLALVRLRYLNRLHVKHGEEEKRLAQARTRVRALADDMGTKHNVHAWRRLEGNAPELLDGIAKIRLLQSKLQRKREELESRLAAVEQVEAEHKRLRDQLRRLPGPEAAEELSLYTGHLQQRRTQLAEMVQSLATAAEESEVLEQEVAQLQEALQDTKHRYYQEKTKNDAMQQELRMQSQAFGAPSWSSRHSRRQGGSRTGRLWQGRAPREVSEDTLDSANSLTMQSASLSARAETAAADRRVSSGGAPAATAASPSSLPIAPQQQQQMAWAGGSGRGGPSTSSSRGRSRTPREATDWRSLTAGTPQPNFPLQKPPHQRQFAGGGFPLSR